MRWKVKDTTTPVKGDFRYTKVFAWKPTQVGKTMVWLERYELVEKYETKQLATYEWDGKWKEVTRNLLYDT